MTFQIPIDTLFTQVFGLAGPAIRRYKVVEDKTKPYLGAYTIEAPENEPELIQSSLGTPVQFPMGFTGKTDYKYLDNGLVKTKFLGGMYLPFTSIASFTRSKRMAETYMNGQDDSVIEMYGFEPWQISIKGFIIKGEKSLSVEGDMTVEQQLRVLQQYEELADAIGVRGKVFEWLNIHQIAIKSISYPEARNLDMNIIKPFEIQARSVKPLELFK